MIYLYWYLGIGAVFLLIVLISHQLAKSPADDQLADLWQAADPDRNRWWRKPLNNVAVPILAAVIVLAVWPITIYWKAKEMVGARRVGNEAPPKKFAVTRDHLQKQWSLAEIESVETVVDPLDAAPRIPFGHLNPAWETFKQSIQDGDQVWSFSAPWTSEWGRREARDGYVILRGETIGPHFLTRWVLVNKRQ